MEREYRINPTNSWEELGEAGERKVLAATPEGFSHFRNILVPCHHGYDWEEIDLIVVGPTGIWSIEVKNWRGIVYPGDYPEELLFIRNTPEGTRKSYRENPYQQARDHAHDLHQYLSDSLKKWFPSVRTLVVFASRDPTGVNGANLDRVRYANSSIIYVDEMQNALLDPKKAIYVWEREQIIDAISRLHTWAIIHFKDGRMKRGMLCRWSGFNRFKVKCGGQTVPIDLGSISRIEIIHKAQSQVYANFVLQSGDTQVGELLDNTIPFMFPDGRIEQIKLTEITKIHTGFPCIK